MLTTLNLSSNHIGPEGAAAVGEALKVNGVLAELDLSDNALCGVKFGRGSSYDASGIQALAEALKVNGVLTKLNLDGHALDLPKLRGTDSVTSLDLSGKRLGPASAIVIASLIAGNEVLATLWLVQQHW